MPDNDDVPEDPVHAHRRDSEPEQHQHHRQLDDPVATALTYASQVKLLLGLLVAIAGLGWSTALYMGFSGEGPTTRIGRNAEAITALQRNDSTSSARMDRIARTQTRTLYDNCTIHAELKHGDTQPCLRILDEQP